jgi:hypothetical protein
MKNGFQLRFLRVSGKGKKPAELEFRPGLNVISGASNTGKSYILQCIDFACGAGTPPKTVDESIGYEMVELELEDNTAQAHKMERSLKGGQTRHFVRTGGDWAPSTPPILGAKHAAADPNTVSGLLLGLSGLWGNKVRKNAAGQVDSLSFRDIARLIFVDEKRIIGDISPFFSGQNTTETKEVSIFNLLLTGVDDSSVIAHETKKESQSRKKAQLELLDRMIQRSEEQLAQSDKEPATVSDRRKRIEASIAERTQIITVSQNEIAESESKRQQAWATVQRVGAKRNATVQLKGRFKLLEEHYNNDLARLNAIVEADHYFSQLQQVRCPLCGAAIENHDTAAHPSEESPDLSNLRTACKEEVRKIQSLLRDLLGTTTQLDSELSSLALEEQEQTLLFQQATTSIQRELAPRAEQLQGELTQLIENRDALAYVEMLQEKLTSLQQDRDIISKAVWRSQAVDDGDPQGLLVPQSTETFTLAVQEILEEWRYPNLKRVTFNNEKLDLIISGKDRESEGKGFRAIAYSAFVIGLLRYCASESLPHPGVVALDSPLVTYRRRDTQPGDAIPEDVSRAFYEALAQTPADRQIIVLENEDPPEDIQAKIHYTHFSRSAGVGRYGFFPVLSAPHGD